MSLAARQAIILAAGEGRRLRPITDHTPKPLVPFWGRPLLDWAVDKLVRAGVERIAINACHLGDALTAHVRTLERRLGRELHVAREPRLLGTGGAVKNLRHWLTPGEPFFVLNADAVFAAPITVLSAVPSLLVTRAWPAERRIVVRPDASATADATAPATTNGTWLRLDEAGLDEAVAAAEGTVAVTFCGLTLADPELPARLPDGASCILRQGYVPFLDRLAVRVVDAEPHGFFADTGSPEALIEAHLRSATWVATIPEPLT